MTVFRIVLFIVISLYWTGSNDHATSDIAMAFLNGLRFDIVITSYIILIPFFLTGLLSLIFRNIRFFTLIIFICLSCLFVAVILIHSADIPYFLQFFSRLTTASLLWLDDSKYMFKLILSDLTFILFLLLFIVLSVFAVYYLFKLRKKLHLGWVHRTVNRKPAYYLINIAVLLLISSLLILGIRGRISKKSPIRIGTAYFCDDQILNKLALNPVFSFGYSFINDLKNKDDKINFMEEETALKLSSEYLNIPESDTTINSLMERWTEKNGSEPIKNNLIIVIMEGMGTYKLGSFNGPKNLTPNLNSIISRSVYFDNIYTAGIHTFNGIYSVLFSFPALYKRQPLEELINLPHNGISQVLKKLNYSNLFFITHDPEFDNVSGFLKANGFDEVYSESDYPSEWVQSTNGVADHRMFEYAVPVLNKLHNKGSAFFAAFMTTSDHLPYIIPDNIDFIPRSEKPEHQITEYADWAIGNFLKQASKEKWYRNTTFIFIADHGLNMGHTYDMPLSYHQTPFIIYTPSSEEIADTLHKLGGQIDLVPTVLGLLNIPYDNQTMGINLFKNKRPFMYFCADDKIGCLDNEYYLILRPDNIETLYRYRSLSNENVLDSFGLKVDSMKKYTYSMMQATDAKFKRIIKH